MLLNDVPQTIDTSNVPDVLDWTPRQVSGYFKQIGYSQSVCISFIRQASEEKGLEKLIFEKSNPIRR